MALAAATAQTWGISGPEFLLAYLVIATMVLVAGTRARRALAGTRARRALADPRPTSPVGPLDGVDDVDDGTTRPHDIAYLNGGCELAVYSALSAMHLRGTISTSRGTVRAVGRLEPAVDELEKAIHLTAATALRRRRLPFHRPVQTALADIEERLVAEGMLLSEKQRTRIRRVGLWMLGVAVLGLVRVLAGVADARPVGLLVVAMLVVAAVATVQLATAPRRTRLGEQTLARLRVEHRALSPEAKPDWRVYGPVEAALGIGVFGTGALWASDPTFADEIAARPVATAGASGAVFSGSSDDGGSSGDGGGGSCGGGGCGG